MLPKQLNKVWVNDRSINIKTNKQINKKKNMNQLLILMGAPAAGQSPVMQFLPLVAIIVVFYFFMIRPQMKKAKEQKKYIEALKKGDKILTIGGIYGKIADIKEDGSIIMEVEDGSKMKISKNAVSQDATSTLNQQ